MVLILLLLLAGLTVLLWVMSNRFLVPEPYALKPEFELGTVAQGQAGEYEVALPVLENPNQFAEVDKDGIFNLLWEDGYGSLGPVTRQGDGWVVRPVSDIVGIPPREGVPARLDTGIYKRNPQEDHGIPYEELRLQSDAGDLRAWWMEGGGERAVLMLHGRRRGDLSQRQVRRPEQREQRRHPVPADAGEQDRLEAAARAGGEHGRRRGDLTETLRITPTLVDEGWSVLSVAYRNHDRSAPSPDGFYHYGQAEYRDALAGLDFLALQGVREVVLYGFSMGGAVSLETIKRWPADGPRLLGLVMDAPLLDPRTVFAHVALRGTPSIPGPLVDMALFMARLRSGIDWKELDQRRYADQLEVPVLLITGTADDTIPVSLVDEFAERVRSPITYLRLDGAEHVEAWNRYPTEYEGAVREFLGRFIND